MGAMHAQQEAGERTAYDPSQGRSRHEQRDGARPRRGWKPAPQIKDHAGKKSGFGGAQQKTQQVKAARAGDKNHRRRNNSPDHHDHGDPLARANLGQSQVAGHLKKEISGKEDTGAQAIDFIAEAQLPLHLQGGKAHIDSIQVGDDIKQKQEGQQAPGKLGDDSGAEVNSSQGWHRERCVRNTTAAYRITGSGPGTTVRGERLHDFFDNLVLRAINVYRDRVVGLFQRGELAGQYRF